MTEHLIETYHVSWVGEDVKGRHVGGITHIPGRGRPVLTGAEVVELAAQQLAADAAVVPWDWTTPRGPRVKTFTVWHIEAVALPVPIEGRAA